MTDTPDHRLSRSGEARGRTLWLRAANYDYTHHLSRPGWAWEFLRRNRHYAADWGAAQSEVTMPLGQGGPVTLRLGVRPSRMHRWGLVFRRGT